MAMKVLTDQLRNVLRNTWDFLVVQGYAEISYFSTRSSGVGPWTFQCLILTLVGRIYVGGVA